MSYEVPTRQEAREALAEAADRAARIRRADTHLRAILLVLAAMYVAVGVLVGLVEQGGSPSLRTGLAAAALVLQWAGLAGSLAIAWRIRALSRHGWARFCLAAVAFSIWNPAMLVASIASGWWGPDQPGLHFTTSFVVVALPLLLGAWLVGRRRG